MAADLLRAWRDREGWVAGNKRGGEASRAEREVLEPCLLLLGDV